jgi:CRP-like cAMP-binding protein
MASPAVRQPLPLFAGLAPASAALLAQAARKRAFRRGQIIFHKGDPGTSLFVIVTGQVKLILPSAAGEEVVLGVLDAGECFGEMAVIDGKPRSATVVAAVPTETLMVLREDFLRQVEAHPQLAIDLLELLARRLRGTDELVADAVFLDIGARIAKKLLDLAEAYGVVEPGGTVIGLRLSQVELARMVGATRESVNKHLRSYQAMGIIALERQRITIRRPEALRRRVY